MIRGELTAFVTAVGLTAVLFSATVIGLDRFARISKQADGKIAVASWLVLVAIFGAWLGLTVLTTAGLMFGQFWVLEIPFQLAFGWGPYFERVWRDVRPDAVSVAAGVVCFVGAAVGLHVFLRWLAATGERPWPVKRTLRLLVLVVLLFASGVAVVGVIQQTGWLIRSPEPLVKDNRQIW